MKAFKNVSANLLSSISLFSYTLLASLLLASPARSAEEISIRYSAAERSISVAELDKFVQTGEISRGLQWYADRLTPEQRATLRAVLQEPLAVDPKVLTTFIEDPTGDALLRRLLAIFWGALDEESLLKALRSSLVLAATDEAEGLTVMNAIRKYPLTKIRIDLAVGLTAANQVKEIFIDSNKIFTAIQQKADTGFISLDDLPTAPEEPGPLKWEMREVTFTNPERDAAELVTADIYLPEGLDATAPLIAISHGVASSRATFAYLAEHLASHGFAVAAVQHPDTDTLRFQQYIAGFAEQPDPRFFIQRPNDITALLDDLEQKIANDPNWQGRLQTDNVGIFGHSLGGYTVLASGGAQLDFEYNQQQCEDQQEEVLPFNLSLLLQCQLQELPVQEGNFRDDRVAAVLAVNPVSSTVFGPNGIGQLQLPTLMVANSHDFFAPAVDEQIEPFTWLEAENRHLLLVENGTHFSFLPSGEGGVFDVPKELIGPDPELAHPAMRWLAVAFFETYISGSNEFKPYLTEFLVPSDTEDFDYALTESFTQEELDAAVKLAE
ncbi:MAG: alpha/beta hydrolase [Synechococcus sp.]